MMTEHQEHPGMDEGNTDAGMDELPELVETETVVEAELVVYDEPTRDLKGAESEEQLAKAVQDHIVNDFEHALNLIRSYQLLCKRGMVPDLHWDEARRLLHKYRMEAVDPVRLVHDGEFGDIATHTDSIPGTAVEDQTPELEAEVERDTEAEDRYLAALEADVPVHNESSELVELTDAETEIAAMHQRRAERPNPEPKPPTKRQVEQLRADGYEDCPICEGTGKAARGVLKGRTCTRCGGYGLWKAPETIKLVGDEHGNFGIQPGQLDSSDLPDDLHRFDDPEANDPHWDDPEADG
jgi:hypothetical protein